MFSKSKVQRFWEEKGKNPSLGPGAYDVDKADTALRSKAYQNVPLSATARWHEDDDDENRGPGYYNASKPVEDPMTDAKAVRKPRPPSFRRLSGANLANTHASVHGPAGERSFDFDVPQAAESETDRLRKRLRNALLEKDNLARQMKASMSRARVLETQLADAAKTVEKVPTLERQARRASRAALAAAAAGAALRKHYARAEEENHSAQERASALELARICASVELCRLQKQHFLLQDAALAQRDAAVDREWEFSWDIHDTIERSSEVIERQEEQIFHQSALLQDTAGTEAYIASLKEEIELLSEENLGLVAEARMANDEASRLSAQLVDSQAACEKERKRVRELKSRLQIAEATIKEKVSSTQDLLKQLCLITDACQRKIKEKGELADRSRAADEQLAQIEATSASLQSRFQAREEELLNKLQESEAIMSEALSDAAAQIACLERDLTESRESMEIVCTEHAERNQAVVDLEEQLKFAKDDIESHRAREQDLCAELEASVQAQTTLRETEADAKRQLAALQEIVHAERCKSEAAAEEHAQRAQELAQDLAEAERVGCEYRGKLELTEAALCKLKEESAEVQTDLEGRIACLEKAISEQDEDAPEKVVAHSSRMAVGKNRKLGKKGKKKKVVDPFTRKDWYTVKAPSVFTVRDAGKSPCTRTTGTKIASEQIKGRIFEVSLADLQKNPDMGHIKIKLAAEDVQGDNVLTTFHGLSLTRDKLCSLIKKRVTLIEGRVDVRTTDGYTVRLFAITFTRKQRNSMAKTCYCQSGQARQIRAKMVQVIQDEAAKCDLKDLVAKLLPETIGKEIEKAVEGIFPCRDAAIRKVKILKKPRFDLSRLMEQHADTGADVGAAVDREDPAVAEELLAGSGGRL